AATHHNRSSSNFYNMSAASTVHNQTHTYSAAGTHTATLTVADTNTATKSASIVISVNTVPTVAAAANRVGGDAPVSVSLSAIPAGGTSPYAFSWNFGDGSLPSTVQNPGHVYAVAGTFTAQLTLTDAAGHTANASVVITVSPTLSATAGASRTR